MSLHTPISGKNLTYHEYTSINNAYSNMVNESHSKSVFESVVNDILGKVKKNYLGKIRKCAKKSVKLATFATQTAVNEAAAGIDCDRETLDEACRSVKKIIADSLEYGDCGGFGCHDRYDDKDFDELPDSLCENDDEEDPFGDFNDDDSKDEPDYVPSEGADMAGGEIDDVASLKDELDKNDRLIKARYGEAPLKDDNEFLYNPQKSASRDDDDDDVDSEEDDEDLTHGEISGMKRFFDDPYALSDKDDDDVPKSRIQYTVTDIKIGISVDGRLISKPVLMNITSADIRPLFDMEEVVDYVNNIIGFYFDIDDYYCDFSKVKDGTYPNPILCARKTLTSDAIQGNAALKKYFGNDGRFSDYLYKADGTAKEMPSDSKDGVDDIKSDVSVVKKFPTLEAYIWLASVALVGKDKKLREIKPYDFNGTAIRVIK